MKKGFQTTKEIKKGDLLARTSGEGDPDPAISDQERGICYGLDHVGYLLCYGKSP